MKFTGHLPDIVLNMAPEASIDDRIFLRFLETVQQTVDHGEELAAELRRLYDHDLLRKEASLIDLYTRLSVDSA